MSKLLNQSSVIESQLTISKLKGLASIQDLGRLSSQHLGFSVSGAADEYGFRFANALLGNNENSAALEVTLGQIHLYAHSDCIIALAGADCQASILNLSGEHKLIKNWQCHQLRQGDVLQLQRPERMLHSYIAVKGGIQSKQWLKSRSQTLNEITLGFTGKKLEAGDSLPINLTTAADKESDKIQLANTQRDSVQAQTNCPKINPDNFYGQHNLILRFIPSVLFTSFTANRQKQLIEQDYNIQSDSNRMGYRLQGDIPLVQATEKGGLSRPVNYGSIQLPNDGQPIILMKDRQTIGGYPVLGTVMQTDL